MSFTRRVEDFTCEHCGSHVAGTGYTNHCPKCLWSKHVDIDPGDRASTCGGMMQPTALEGATGSGYMILHKCTKCGFERRNKVAEDDEEDAILKLAENRLGTPDAG